MKDIAAAEKANHSTLMDDKSDQEQQLTTNSLDCDSIGKSKSNSNSNSNSSLAT